MSNFVLSILIEAKDSASSVLGGVGDALSGLGKAGLVVAGAGIAALGGALIAAVGNAIDAQDVFAQTQAVVKSTGGAAGLSAQQMADLASSLSAAAGESRWGDELILQGENVLATFTNIGRDVFPLATQASLDMAQALHSTPEAMSMLLGKALSSAQGLTALTKSGVRFNAEQLETIKRLFATGHAAEAQKMILAELATEFGGSAAAAAATFSGQLGTLKDKFGEVLEGIGLKLLPVLTQFVGFLNSPDVQTGIAAFADALINGIGQAAMAIGPILSQLGPLLAAAFQVFTTEILPTLLAGWQQLQNGVTVLAALFGGEWTQATTNAYAALSNLFGPGTVNAVLGAIGAVRDTFAGLAATFSDARNPIDGFLAVLSRISPTFALVKAGVDAALPPIHAIVTSVFGIIGGFLEEHGDKIRSDVGGAWQQIQAIIAAVTPPIQQIISTVFGAVAAFLQAHGAEIQAFLGQTWDAIAQIIGLALQIIQATIVPAITAIAGFISAHGTEIQGVLNVAWQTIRTVITTVLGVIRGILTAALAAIHGDWAGAWEAIKGVASTIWEGIKSLLQLNLELITIIFKGAWDGIKAYFEQLLSGIVGFVIQTMLGIANAIRDFGSQAAGAAASLGGSIVSGIVDGIRNGIGAIADAARHAAQAALDAAMHLLDAHSPSGEFMKIGGYAGSGFALGMTNAIPTVTGAARDMAGASLTGAQSITNSTTYNLTYQGVAQSETDVRHALRAQALLTGATQ